MTYRRVILFGFAAFFCALLWRVVGATNTASETLAWTLVAGVVIILMLPETRLQVGELLEGLKAWRSRKDDKL